jgi:hypothetical protein
LADETCAFERVLQHYWPGIRTTEVVELLGRKASRPAVSNWRHGRRNAPSWAIEALCQHASAFESVGHDLAAQAKKETGPGKRAGAINLAKWLAANPR